MVAHARPLHVAKRQTPEDPLTVPTAAGIDPTSVTSVATGRASDATSLAFDGSVTATGGQSAPNLAPTETALPTITSGSVTVTTSNPAAPSPTEPTVAAASSKNNIALSTVIGSCVGAFIGATALIVFGLWLYRRYSKSLQKRTRGPLIHARNITADQQRRQSRLEPWNKLEDSDDKWEGMYQTKETREVDQVAPMEKLTMFKKTPSVRTAYTHKSADLTTLDFPQSYAEFDPKLAQTLTTSVATMPGPRPFMGRDAAADPPQSWNSDNTASKSFLSIATQMSSGAMSPTLHMAIPTPNPTVTQTHMWESAEVEHVVENPDDQRRSVHNPFFSARDDDPLPRSRSNSVTKSPKAKGKERMRYSNDPFDDINEKIPRPKFIQHLQTASESSTESKEKALQSLIAALDISEEDARSRLRIASMQPSIISNVSSVLPDDEDVTKDFPLPPSRSGGSSQYP